MKKTILSIALCFLCINCSNTTAPNENNNNTTWVFVANEGEYDFSGQTNTGTISMIDSHGNVYETENLGDIVQSLVVYDDKLIASVNNSQKILIFDISASGISNKHEIKNINDSLDRFINYDLDYISTDLNIQWITLEELKGLPIDLYFASWGYSKKQLINSFNTITKLQELK